MKTKKIIISVLVLIMSIVLVKETYAYYSSVISVGVNGNVPNLECEVDVSALSPSEVGIYGYAGLEVTVQNKSSENLPFTYTLTIENDGGVNTLFSYNGVFDDHVTITGSIDNEDNTRDQYIIPVKPANGEGGDLYYSYNIKCVQDN